MLILILIYIILPKYGHFNNTKQPAYKIHHHKHYFSTDIIVDTLMEIAKILNVNYINFITEAPGCAEDIMQTFFWLDEDNRNTFHLFQLVRNPDKCNASDDKSVCYNDSDEWPAHAPVGMWIDYGLVNEFLREWCLRKEQLKSGEISEDEYFEWKINWPATSSKVDYNGKDDKKCSYNWRKHK